MATRKPKPAEQEAMTKREVSAALIAAGIFAGPAGFGLLDKEEQLQNVADIAVHFADLLAARLAA